jgi:peptide/nickel transport system permease protein
LGELAEATVKIRHVSESKLILYKFKRNKLAVIGTIILVILAICALLAPFITPKDPFKTDLKNNLSPPTMEHWLGTDELGRDILSRIIYGATISLTIGLVSVSIALVCGVPLGAIAGYHGGWTDSLIMRFMDILLSLPSLLLAIVVVTILGPNLYNAMIAVGVSIMPVYARLVRSMVLYLKEMDFVEAARMVGASDLRIIFRHIMPNCLAPIIVQSTLNIASAILSAAALGFLGLGAQPPTPEWGLMLSKGRIYLLVDPYVSAFPGLAILITVLAFNMVGDGLRDALDPKMT